MKKHILKVAVMVAVILLVVNSSYAQGKSDNPFSVPEPGSIALVFTGIVGSIIQFARRRFEQFKKCFDVIVGSIGLVVSLPVMGLTAAFIKMVSSGPAFYTQERVGLNGKIFRIYKMRTMTVDAEKYTGAVWAQEDDPRLIPLGKFIRRAHLDELPQFVNVLRGEMSIVGPRPERPVFVKQLSKEIPCYTKRLSVKPGITGLAQVVHKYDETIKDVKKKVKYDLLYIREMCLMVDIRILLRTIVVAVQGKGAR